MDKSPDAFRTISEVAEWLGVQTHVLRFWESKFSQVKPVKRAGGRRYYRPADMALLGGIKALLHDEGMTIKGVQKLLREEGVAHVSTFSQPLDTDAEISGTSAISDHDALPAAQNVLRFKARPEDRAGAETGAADPVPDPGQEAGPAQATPKAEDAPAEANDKTPEEAVEKTPVAAPPAPPEPTRQEAAAAEPDAPDSQPAPAEPDASPLPSFLTQPMGAAPGAEPPRARVVDAPDPPPEAQIATRAGALSHLGVSHSLDAEQSQALAPLLGRLAVLRDRMADPRG